jgi:hypothetical protein
MVPTSSATRLITFVVTHNQHELPGSTTAIPTQATVLRQQQQQGSHMVCLPSLISGKQQPGELAYKQHSIAATLLTVCTIVAMT